MVETLVKRAGM
jgi:hypothetical protein